MKSLSRLTRLSRPLDPQRRHWLAGAVIALSAALIAPGDPSIRAVASDVSLQLDRPVLNLNDTGAIADFILRDLRM